MCDTRSQTALTAWLTMAVIAMAATRSPERWALDLTLVRQGEWWRLVSGQFVHLSWRHYGYDLLALGMALYLCSRVADRFRSVALTALGAACAVSAVLLVTHPVDIYGGLSGITAGLISFAALSMIGSGMPAGGFILLAGMLLKIVLESRGLSISGVAPVWTAHCAGVAAGCICSAYAMKPAGRTIRKQARESIP